MIAVLRPGSNARRELEAAVIALLVTIAIGSVLMLLVGASPGRIWGHMVSQTVTEPYYLGQALYRATGFALCGLAVAIALDAGLFNIGAEAQVAAGVLLCAVVGAALPAATPAIVAIPVCVLAAAAGGAVIGAAIGALKAWRDAHEVITSIMLNAIVFGVSLWIGNEWLFQGGTTRGPDIAPGAELPQLPLAGSSASAALAIALVAVGAVWWLRSRTTWGVAWRAVGQDPAAARTVGISVARVQIFVMAGAGALAGLAATNFVLGHKHAFEEGLGRGTGILGISAALLGRLHPLGILAASLFLGFLSSAGLTVGTQIPKELTEMLQGVVVLAVAAAGPWVARRSAIGARA